ncbi:uncharacterized protein LOC127709288 isoform X2 [Mytilus californianus]|uniref:uncharacterized protein LOC127709288 isoform X1 n=1 Tax=Mytilus californianus TaxID=6549 RepID=UPI0022462B66|nr:uncharacterized protein LOC127709288 isoform X1 [Mytilus californianus]XP_052070707.1 uncharacterized protein LOC127709288 isoform X2 [Mytilus californianus]
MCEVCHVIVRDLQILVAENNTQAKAEGDLNDICNRLTANTDTCLAFVKDNIGKVFSKLSNGLDPEQICISLKVCPSLEKDILTKVLPAPVSNDIIPNEINEITQDIGANPIECELCKLVVTYVEKRLLNNKSEDAINATLEEICNELPGQLGALCQKFEPELLKALVDEFSAEKACKAIRVCAAEDAFFVHEPVLSCKDCKDIMEGIAGETGIQVCLQMAGICGKSKIQIQHESTNLVEPESYEEPNGLAECTLCKFVMREVDNLLSSNKSEAAVNASLQQICNSLPDQLQGLCQQFAPILLIAIKNGLDPNMACTQIKLCNNEVEDYDLMEMDKKEFENYDLVVKEALKKVEKEKENDVKASIGCTLCKFIIQEIDNFIVQNQSSAAINASVYNLCSKLPAPLDKLCYSYAPVIVKDVVSGFDPELTCEKVKLCTNDSVAMTKDFPSSNIEEIMIKAGPGCAICKLIVQEIDAYIAQNKTVNQINATVFEFCGKLPNVLTSLCMTYAPIIVNDVVLGFDPEKTCEKVKLCTNDSISWSPRFESKKIEEKIKEKVEASPGCTLCKFIVQTISNYTTQNQSAAAINASVYNLCNELPALLKNLCTTYAPIIINDITAGFDPEQTCEKVKLCTNGSLSYEEVTLESIKELENIKASPGCTICKFIIQEIDHFIVLNESASAINASVYNLCSKLPAPLDKLCYGYAPVIVQDVVSGFDPKQTCEKFKLCTNESLSYQESQLEFTEDFKNFKDGPECAICKLLVQEIDSYIVQNKSASEINATVYEFCNNLPAPLNSMCTTYAPMIVKDLVLGFDPEQTCEKLKLCSNGSFVQPFLEEVEPKEQIEEKVEADPLCVLCEFVVQLLDQYLASNKTTAAVNSSVMQICNLLPGSLKGQCILFAPQIVTMVTSGVAPENACKQAKLCPAVNGPFFQKELTELSCGQCHGIVEFLLPQKYNPEFGNLICKAACPVARRRRSVDDTPQIFMEFMKAAKMTKTWRCDLCEWIIEAINVYVQTNVTDQSLEDYMNDICHFMPEPFKDECLKSVPEIIKELSHGFDEDVLCQHYIPDECNGSSVAAVDKPVAAFFDEKKDKDVQCEICKHIIKYIDENLNHDKNVVKMYVDDVCGRLPSPTNKACKSFAAAEIEEILLKIINKILSPEDVCHMITVC